MASKRTSMLSLSQLLAEVDMLERELKDLGREAQRGEDFNNQLQEIVDRDLKNVERTQKEINKISQEILELESKERFLTEAVNTGIQSSQLLVQMETQARNKLEEEREATSQLKEQLRCQVGTFAKKVEKEEIAYGKIPEYMKILQYEERIRSKSTKLQSMERERNQAMGQMEVAAKDVVEDREAWRGFKASCLNLAEQWLKMRNLRKEIETLSKEKEDLNVQVKSIMSERNLVLDKSAIQISVSNGPNNEAERHNDDHASSTLPVPKPSGQNVDSASHMSHINSSIKFSHSADTDNTPTNFEKPSLMISNLSSIPGYPSLPPPPTMFTPPSTTSSYVPPTPRTKKLHLQLGTSLLTKRKAGSVSVSATASTDIARDNPTSTHQASDGDGTPSTTSAVRIEKDTGKVSSSPIHEINKPVKKSFKLGLTSLFGRKKPSSVVQGSQPNEELLARTPTLPHHEQESVRNDHVKGNVEDNMDVDEDDVGKDSTKSCQVESITTSNKGAEDVQQEKEVVNVSTGEKTAYANYLSCHPTVEEVVTSDNVSTFENTIPNQQLSVTSDIPSLDVMPTLSILTPRVSTMEISSSPSPHEGRQPMCVSPGTALSDQKRKAGLQQLLESPQTTTINGSDFNGGAHGFGIVEKGSSVNGAENNDGYFGVEQGNINFGDSQSNTENSFSFFGGGSGKLAEENAGDENFAFSFGGADGEQDNVQGGGDTFGFSFGGDFEDQMGGGGFSLF